MVSKGLLVDVDDEHLPSVACVAWGACGVGARVAWGAGGVGVGAVRVRCERGRACGVSVGVRAVWERGVAWLWSDLAQVAVESVEVLPVKAW